MKLTFGVDSPQYRADGYFHEINAWVARCLPDQGRQTFRVDLVDEGVVCVHHYDDPPRTVDGELVTHVACLPVREMPDPAWFDR